MTDAIAERNRAENAAIARCDAALVPSAAQASLEDVAEIYRSIAADQEAARARPVITEVAMLWGMLEVAGARIKDLEAQVAALAPKSTGFARFPLNAISESRYKPRAF